jgi:hypothetical protein
MACKVSYIFRQDDARAGGWAESYYTITDPPDSVSLFAVDRLRDMLRGLKGKQTICTGVRIAQLGGQRLTKNIRYSPGLPGTFGGVGGFGEDSDYLTTSVNIFLTPGVQHRPVSIWMSGVSDVITSTGGYFIGNTIGQWNTNFAAYAFELITQSNGWRVMVTLPGRPQFRVSGLAPPVVTAKGGNWQEGQVVKLIGMRPAGPWTPSFSITNVTNNTFEIVNGPAPPWTTTPGSKPSVYVVGRTPTAITLCTVNFSTSHRRGRPIGQHTGRRKAVKH